MKPSMQYSFGGMVPSQYRRLWVYKDLWWFGHDMLVSVPGRVVHGLA